MQTFFCDEDYQEYLSLLGHWCGEFDVRIWAYCLMPNHVHLILVPSAADGLCRAVAEVHRRYTRNSGDTILNYCLVPGRCVV